MTSITLPVTLNGNTREVEFTECRKDLYISKPIFAARIGNGAKVHTTHMLAFVHATKEDAYRLGYSFKWNTLVEKDGVLYGLKRDCVVLNKQATIYGFKDELEVTSQHKNENRYAK